MPGLFQNLSRMFSHFLQFTTVAGSSGCGTCEVCAQCVYSGCSMDLCHCMQLGGAALEESLKGGPFAQVFVQLSYAVCARCRYSLQATQPCNTAFHTHTTIHKLPRNSVAMVGAWQAFKHAPVCYGQILATPHNLFAIFSECVQNLLRQDKLLQSPPPPPRARTLYPQPGSMGQL